MINENLVLPDIVIPSEKMDQFKSNIIMLEKIAMQFGLDFSHLFGEICIIYDTMDEDALKAEAKACILGMLGNLNHVLRETSHINDALSKNDSDSYVLQGRDYIQIFTMLGTLRTNYMSLLRLIGDKKYFSKEFIDTIHERMQFIISVNFEELKSRFKLIETMNNAVNNPNTVH